MRASEILGQTVCGTYVVEKLIGTGTMGMVLEVRHVRLPKRFAMKILHGELAEGSEAFARFRREAEITSSLGHPHIVDVVDWNRLDDQTPFLIMEHLSGEDLHTRLGRVGHLPLGTVLEMVRQVGSALAAAHKHGVVHRDLKPQNIFLCKEDRGDEEVEIAKVLDFGISKILGDSGSYTGAVRVMGTPLYMAPEQAMGFTANVDGRADQFALAAIAYHALSGRRPFDGSSVVEIALKVMGEDPPPLRQLVPEVPEHVERAITRALSKEREQRFDTISDFVRALGIAQRTTFLTVPAPGTVSEGAPIAVSGSIPQATQGGPKVSGSLPPGPEGPPALGMGLPSRLDRSAGGPVGPVGMESLPLLTRPPLLGPLAQGRLLFALLVILVALPVSALTRVIGRRLVRPRPALVTPQPPPPVREPPVVRPPPVARVTLRFSVMPVTAEVLLDGRRVPGPGDRQIEVPKGEVGLHLEVKAPGYSTQTDTVVPQSDQRILIHLAPSRRKATPTPVPPPW